MSGYAGEGSTDSAALVAVGVVGAAIAALAFVLYGGKAAGSAAFGTVLAVANLWVLGKVIRSMMPAEPEGTIAAEPDPPKKGSAAAWGVFAVLKVFLLFGCVLAAVNLGLVTPLGFLVGYAALPIGIVMAQLTRGMSAR